MKPVYTWWNGTGEIALLNEAVRVGPNGKVYTNTASVTATTADPNPSNNSASAQVEVRRAVQVLQTVRLQRPCHAALEPTPAADETRRLYLPVGQTLQVPAQAQLWLKASALAASDAGTAARVLGAEGSEALTMTDDERRLHVCRLDSAGDAGCFGDLRLFGLTHTLGLDDRGLVPVPNGSGVAQLVLRGGSCDAVFARGTDGSVRVLAREACNVEGLDRRSTEQLDGVSGVRGVSDLAVGPGNACVIHSNGKVACWGEDLAWGTASSLRESSTPTDVEGVRDAVQLAVGWGHACARTRSGHVTCWGGNVHGSLGDGSARTRLSARVIPGLDDVSSIAASNSVTCAVTGGALMCWGEEMGPDGEDARTPTRQAL